MAEGPFGGPRIASEPQLEMQITDSPVPEGDDEGVFPDGIVFTDDVEQQVLAIVEDKVQQYPDITNPSVDRETSVMRGLGQTDKVTITVNVNGAYPGDVDSFVQDLVDEGFMFSYSKLR